jgi:hypothetical protein
VFQQRWDQDSRPLKVLTGSIDKLIKWGHVKESSAVLFEVIGEQTI